jgi:putative phosphoribosyl transferase
MKIAHEEVRIPSGAVAMTGDLDVMDSATGVVLCVHGSGSSRFSPRNRFLALELHTRGLSTLLLDLLTPEEESLDFRTTQFRYDIDLLAGRVLDATEWLRREPQTRDLPLAYFGASTAAAALLVAAARRPDDISAVVSRAGRPDLAVGALPNVQAATLLIVGANDTPLLRLNREAHALLTSPRKLEVVEGAGHLFDEPGALQGSVALAAEWITTHLPVVAMA